MHLSSGRLQLAATDLGRFLSCRYQTALDLEVAFGKRAKPPVYPDPLMELLREGGFAHEKEYTEELEASGAHVLDIGGITNPRGGLHCCADQASTGTPTFSRKRNVES